MDTRFEDFLVGRNDELDSAAYQLMRLMLALPEEEAEDDPFPWDMQHIGELEDFIDTYLAEHGHLVCHPYYEGDEGVPCYRGEDCERKTCPFKENHKEGEQ